MLSLAVSLQVANSICVEKFSDFPQLGRFTLRTEGKDFKRLVLNAMQNIITKRNIMCMLFGVWSKQGKQLLLER